MKNQKTLNILLFLLILATGSAIRLYQFPHIPPGLNQDEANSAYETFSLLTTGKDKWGNPYPAYFPSWGSGQNVLLAYISIPFVKVFGLNIFSTRIVSLILGILTLPLFFFSLRPAGRSTALTGMFLLAIVPWHFMLSRWALESNVLPFFMLAGCFMFSRAIITRQNKWIIPSLIPFALALYAYGTTAIALPFFTILILLLFFKEMRIHYKSWLIAFGLFLLVALPFLIFFAENHLFHRNFAWTDKLFFSTPILPSSRVDQISSSGGGTLLSNIDFLISGCNDGTNYNLIQGYKLLFHGMISLWIAGSICFVWLLIKKKIDTARISSSTYISISVFLAWALASLPFLYLFPLNVNRFNHFYIPCIAIASWFISYITNMIRRTGLRTSIRIAILVFFAAESSLSLHHYFTEYPQGRMKIEFYSGLEKAFEEAAKLPAEQISITQKMDLPYVYTLFYLQYPSDKFRKEVDVEIVNGEYKVKRFGKFVFYNEYLDKEKSTGYLCKKAELTDSTGYRQVHYSDEMWEVGIMK